MKKILLVVYIIVISMKVLAITQPEEPEEPPTYNTNKNDIVNAIGRMAGERIMTRNIDTLHIVLYEIANYEFYMKICRSHVPVDIVAANFTRDYLANVQDDLYSKLVANGHHNTSNYVEYDYEGQLYSFKSSGDSNVLRLEFNNGQVYTINCDLLPPEILVYQPDKLDTSEYQEAFEASFYFSDNNIDESTITILDNNGNPTHYNSVTGDHHRKFQPPGNKLSYEFLTSGVFNIEVESKDSYYNNMKSNFEVKIDVTGPAIPAITIDPPSLLSWTKEDSITFTAEQLTDDDVESYYWMINGNPQENNELSLTINSNQFTTDHRYYFEFYAIDEIGNFSVSDTYYVGFDTLVPSINAAEFDSIINHIDYGVCAKFSWEPSSQDSGSTIVSNVDILLNYQEYTPYLDGNYIYIPLDGNLGADILITTTAEDEAGNSYSEEDDFKMPDTLNFSEGSFNDSEPYNASKPIIINQNSAPIALYPVTLDIKFNGITDIDSYNHSQGISYVLELLNKQGNLISSNVIVSSQLSSINGTSNSKRLSINISDPDTISGGDFLTYNLKTIYHYGLADELELYNDTLYKALPIIGSKPSILHSVGTGYTNTLPTIALSENFSSVGLDIDGNPISYDLEYAVSGIETYTNLAHYTDAASFNLSNIFGIDGKNIISTSGRYLFRVVATGNAYSAPIELKYDKDKPSNPSITATVDYSTADTAFITIPKPYDTGGSGTSKVLVWSENTSDDNDTLSSVTEITTFPITNDSLDLAPGREGFTDTIRIYAKSVDNAGNESDNEGLFEVVIDKNNPSITDFHYTADVDSITYIWTTDEDTYFKIGDEWSTTASTSGTFTKSGLTADLTDSFTIYIKDTAGNVSTIDKSGRTLDSIDPVSNFTLTPTVEGGFRYIQIEFPTTATKFSRYIISDVTGGNNSPPSSKIFSNGVATYKFIYNKIQVYSYGVTLANSKISNPDINTLSTNLTKATINYIPEFGPTPITPLNDGYIDINGSLTWPSASDFDETDVLEYTVIIQGSSDSDPIIEQYNSSITQVSLVDLLGESPENNEIYEWSILVSDGAGGTDTIAGNSFSIDDNKPVITSVNTKYNDYTTALSFTVTDDRNGSTNSGIKSVTIEDNGNSFAGYTKSGNTYSINLSEIDSGNHTFGIYALDNVNNNSNDSSVDPSGYTYNIQSVEIEYDKDAPIINGDVTTNLTEIDNGSYINTSSSIIVNVPVKDTLLDHTTKETQSGVSNVYYQFSSTISPVEADWEKYNSSGSSETYRGTRSVTASWNAGDNSGRYLIVRVQDAAGNYSLPKMLSYPIYTDRRSPRYVSHSVSGLYTTGSSKYISDISTLSITPIFEINSISLATDKYGYILKREGSSDITLRDKGSTTNNSVSLVDGATYSLNVIAYNNAGKTSSRDLVSFIYDNSLPIDGNVTLLKNQNFFSGEEVGISFSALDTSSGIISAEVKIGTTSGSSDISDGVITLNSSWNKDGSVYTNDYSFKLPNDIPDGDYNIETKFFDGVNKSCFGYKTFTVNNSTARLNIDVPRYTSNESLNRFEWDFNYPETIASLSYRISNNGTGDYIVIDYNTNNGIFDFTDNLVSGLEYIVELELIDDNNTTFSTSSIITYDSTAPVENGTDLHDWPLYSSSSILKVKWDLTESESQITDIKHKIEAYREKSDKSGFEWETVMDWESPSTLTNVGEVLFSPTITLNEKEVPILTQGERVRISRTVTNNVGKQSDRISPVIIIDDTIPDELTNINDYVNFMKTSSETTDRPRVNWINTQTDDESNMDYYWTFRNSLVGFDSIPESEWKAGDSSKFATENMLTSINGETWYFILKGTNGVGMETYGFSNGITYDDNAPDYLEVKLVAEGHTTNINYLKDTHKELELNVDATDLGNITYTADYGIFDSVGKYIIKGSLAGSKGIFEITKSDLTAIDGVIFFRSIATDEAGNITEEGFSDGTIYDNYNPEVINLEASFSDQKLSSSWDSNTGKTDIATYRVTLKKNSNIITLPNNGVVTDKSILIDTSDKNVFSDGVYTLEVEATSISGLSSDAEIVNNLIIDNNDPVITNIESSVLNNIELSYVYKILSPVIAITEEGTSIKKYKYSVGTTGDLDLLTNGWIVEYVNILSGNFTPEIDLYSFIDGYNRIDNTDTIYLSFMVQDAGGNWSEIITCDGITLDKTLAQNIEVNVPEFLNKRDRVIDISIKGKDFESGINDIKITLYKVIDGIDTKVDEIIKTSSALSITDELDIANFTFTKPGLTLNDASTYRLRLDIRNGTHLYNDYDVAEGDFENTNIIYSNIFTVDLTAPEITYGTFTTYQTPPPLVPIFNSNGDTINFTFNEPTTVKFELFKDNVVSAVDIINMEQIVGNTNYSYSFNHNFVDEEDAYGTFTLKATVTDRAGNVSEYKDRELNNISIRYNQPPRISFNDSYYMTTPWQPFTIIPKEVKDNDGDTLKSYSWIFNTNSHSDKSVSTFANPIVRFLHDDIANDTTTYSINLTVTDSNDKSESKTHYVTVKNTGSGQLYDNEYWMGDHNIVGNVTVPYGITLQVNDNTNVNFYSGSGLSVDGALIALSGSTFTKGVDISDNWAGIVISNTGRGSIGELDKSIVTIEKAVRGITIIDTGDLNLTNSTITNTLIQNNIIGVHAYNSNPVISKTTIQNNSAYGLKEDKEDDEAPDPEPEISEDTIFENNTIDYYDTIDTAIYNFPGDNE